MDEMDDLEDEDLFDLFTEEFARLVSHYRSLGYPDEAIVLLLFDEDEDDGQAVVTSRMLH